MKPALLTAQLFTLATMAATAPTAMLKIENTCLTVKYDTAAGTFRVAATATGKGFLTNGRLEGAPAKARVEAAKDRVFGTGERIVVTLADGGENSIELYKQLPFVLVRGMRHNAGTTALDVTNAVPATFMLDLDKPAGELCTVGTGGLLAPDKNPGSYLFLTCADAATRRGVVAGWLSVDRGCGVVFSCVKEGAVEFKAQIDFGLAPATKYHAFDFWANEPMADFKDSFKDKVAPTSCRVIAVRADAGHPLALSTSRHVTQGIIDVTGEEWTNGTLAATSAVVGHDPYELRIAGLADGGTHWQPGAAAVSAADKAAGIAITMKECPGILRVTINAPTSRKVKWTVAFNRTQ